MGNCCSVSTSSNRRDSDRNIEISNGSAENNSPHEVGYVLVNPRQLEAARGEESGELNLAKFGQPLDPTEEENVIEQLLNEPLRRPSDLANASLQRVDNPNTIAVNGMDSGNSPQLGADNADEVINVVYLFASPFAPGVELLDAKSEIDSLLEVLRDVAKKEKVVISFQALVATSHNRLETLQNRPTILYIASHCNEKDGALCMEDSEGNYKSWTADLIKDYFMTTADVAKPPIQCAIIGACYSGGLAKLFMEHGNIQHVVAIKESKRVSDKAMSAFVQEFLSKILKFPVRKAFHQARIVLRDDRHTLEAGSFELHQQNGFEDHKLSFRSAGVGHLRDDSPKYQFQCVNRPVLYVNKDYTKLNLLYKFFVSTKRALGVLQAPRGYGSTTTAIHLADHLAPRRVFHGIYYIPLEAYMQQTQIKRYEETCIVRCVVDSLQKDMPGLGSCQSLPDLIAAVTDNLHEKCKATDERDVSPKRILFIFDGCCTGENIATGGSGIQFQTTLIADLVCKLLSLGESVSVLAVCHKHVVFPLHDGQIVQNSFQLDLMSDIDIAKLVLRGSVRKISLDEYATVNQKEEILNIMKESQLKASALADEVFSQSPIVRELRGMPAAARIFSQRITQKKLTEVEFYVELAKQSVAHAMEIKRPFLTDYTFSPRSTSADSQASTVASPLSPLSPQQAICPSAFIAATSKCNNEYSSFDDAESCCSEDCNAMLPTSANGSRRICSNTKGSYQMSSSESNSSDLKSAGCDDYTPSSPSLYYSAGLKAVGCDDDTISSPSIDTIQGEYLSTATVQDFNLTMNWEGFQMAFYNALRSRGVTNPQKLVKEDFFDLATTSLPSSVKHAKFSGIYSNVLALAEICWEIFDGGPVALVNFYTDAMAERRLNNKDVNAGNCMLRVSENSPTLVLSWIILEGGERILTNVTVVVESGPAFRCGNKVYDDLNSVVREEGGGSLSHLCPNIPIDGNGNLENRRIWKSTHKITSKS